MIYFNGTDLNAQITITRDDIPPVGAVVVRDMDSANISNPGGSGINQVWDFSGAVSYYSDTVVFANPSDIPDGNLFTGANLAEGRTVFEVDGTFSNYIYWNNSNSGLYAVGWSLNFGSPEFTYMAREFYSPNPNTLPFPLTFGLETAASTTAERTSSTRVGNLVLDSSRVVSHITQMILVDGSGVVTTPAGTYNSLRVREMSNHIDSTWSWTPFGGWEFEGTESYEMINYRWFANDFGEVATLSFDETFAEFQYLSSIIVSSPGIKYSNEISLYPNPAGDMLYIKTNMPVYRVEVFNLNGQPAIPATVNKEIDISNLKPGMYITIMETANGYNTQRFVKK